eukprot:2088410-Pleurochrysis_carterae.AAC.1
MSRSDVANQTRQHCGGAHRVQRATQKVKEPIVDLTIKATNRHCRANDETAARAQRCEREGARRWPIDADVEASRQRRGRGVRVEPDEPCADSEICVNAAEC